MRFLITGGAGFIGSHLAEALLKRAYQVCILDDLSTGSLRNLAHLAPYPEYRFVLGGVSKPRLLAELVDYADVVVHLAAAVGTRLILERPRRSVETNVNTGALVLKTASRRKKPVFIASTSEVYGKNASVPFREDADLVLGPTTSARC